MNPDLIQRFLQLTHQKRALAETLKQATADWAECEREMLDAFAESGQRSVGLDSGITLSIAHQWRATFATDIDTALPVLRASGCELPLTMYASSLASWVRDYIAEHGAPAPEWDGILHTEYVHQVRVAGLSSANGGNDE